MRLEDEIKQSKFKSEYHKAAVNLIYTRNWLDNFYNSFTKGYDITVQQFNVLRILRGQYPNSASIKLLKERMLDKMSDASRLVEKLRLKGYATRVECPTDRRNVDVKITPHGLELLAKLDSMDTEAEHYLSGLTVTEIKQLNDLLDKLRG